MVFPLNPIVYPFTETPRRQTTPRFFPFRPPLGMFLLSKAEALHPATEAIEDGVANHLPRAAPVHVTPGAGRFLRRRWSHRGDSSTVRVRWFLLTRNG